MQVLNKYLVKVLYNDKWRETLAERSSFIMNRLSVQEIVYISMLNSRASGFVKLMTAFTQH